MVIKLMTTISCSFWRRFSVNFGSMLGWIIKSLLRCCTRCRSSRAWPALPRPWATCSNSSRYKQKSKTTHINNQRITGLQRGDKRGLVDEHLGGGSQSFFWRDPRHWRPARLGDWHSGGSEQHCCWILPFFIEWFSFLFEHIFALDINHLLRLAVERRESWTIRRLSKCSWSLEVRPNQDSWSCQCSLISIKDNQRPSDFLFCESEELESTAAKVFTCTICKSAQLQRQILETGDKGISSLSRCRWSHLTYFWCHSLRADRSDKSEESDKGGRANDGLPEILFWRTGGPDPHLLVFLVPWQG